MTSTMRRLLPIAALAAAALVAALIGAQPAEVPPIEISSLDDRPSWIGPAEYFTGTAVVDPLFDPREPKRASGALVTFTPGARTAWHSHPAGQTLIVTEGVGWVQAWGGERREIRPGDVVWTPPGVKHWHGGTDTHSMAHVAIQDAVDGEVVEWIKQVTDEQYLGETSDEESAEPRRSDQRPHR